MPKLHRAIIHDMAETYKEEGNQRALSVVELRSRIIQAYVTIWKAGSAHPDSSGRASTRQIAEGGCLLVNNNRLDQAKVTAL
jgi:hypothetical protein